MRAVRWAGVAGLGFLLLTCGGTSVRLDAQVHSTADKSYPSVFCSPPGGQVGIGFSPLGHYTSDSSYAQAAETACRLLSWSTQVRVKGERLFEQTPMGGLEFRGESFELLDLPDLTPESCHLESLAVDRHAWIVAVPSGGGVADQGATSFTRDQPGWISEMPQDAGWLYSLGISPISFRNEPGTWEMATYEALVELAVSVETRAGAVEKTSDGRVWSATVLEVDTALRGFQVAGRWRDRTHAYVLARVPAAAAVSYLSSSPE